MWQVRQEWRKSRSKITNGAAEDGEQRGEAARENAVGKSSHCAMRRALKQTLKGIASVWLGDGKSINSTAANGTWAGERNRVRGWESCGAIVLAQSRRRRQARPVTQPVHGLPARARPIKSQGWQQRLDPGCRHCRTCPAEASRGHCCSRCCCRRRCCCWPPPARLAAAPAPPAGYQHCQARPAGQDREDIKVGRQEAVRQARSASSTAPNTCQGSRFIAERSQAAAPAPAPQRQVCLSSRPWAAEAWPPGRSPPCPPPAHTPIKRPRTYTQQQHHHHAMFKHARTS